MNDISFQYPVGYLFLIALGAFLISFLLYFRHPKSAEVPSWAWWTKGILRFLALFFIGLLLLNPMINTRNTETKKPVVLIAQDNSESIKASTDSVSLLTLKQKMDQIESQLSGDFVVKRWSFDAQISDSTSIDYSGKATNISSVFESAYNAFGVENLAAIVLPSDGIFNEGNHPSYILDRLKIPVYPVLLGDTIQRKDLKIQKVFHNKIAYLGDKFNVQVDLRAFNALNQKSRLTVTHFGGSGSRLIGEQSINIDKEDFFQTVEFTLEAKEPGVQRYRFTLSPVAGEISTVNNSREIFIDVLDGRQKILILAYAPHPDISALKQILESNNNFQVEFSLLRQFAQPITNYDLVIFHQLPAKGADINSHVSNLNSKQIPRLFIVGQQTDLAGFNNVQKAITIRSGTVASNEVTGIVNPGFSLFNLESETARQIATFNPMTSLFGDFVPAGNTEVLLKQRIGKVDTDYPLLMFHTQDGSKVGVLAAEGIWKWRLFDYLQHENFNIIEELVGKSINYLSVKEDKRRFRVFTPKNIFDENERLVFGAELYNESYELVNDPDVHLKITNEAGQEFTYVFNKREKAYYLEPGVFPVGAYRYSSYVEYAGKRLTFDGRFSIQAIEKELYELTADHGMLRGLSSAYGGSAFYINNAEGIADSIRMSDRIKPVIYEFSKTFPLLNFKWLFFIIILLLAAEWFMRKYYGGY